MRLLSPQLQAFISVARLGTVHAAAALLGITQTAVTQRVQVLESDLGASLFIRSRRGMQLTDPGQALLKYCKEAEDLEGEALAQIGSGEKIALSKIVIEGPSSILRSRIIPPVTEAALTQTQLVIEFRVNDANTCVQSLKRGQADLVICRKNEVMDELDSRLLKPERYILVGATSWKDRKLSDIVRSERIVDFDSGDQMTFSWLEKYELKKGMRSDRHFVNNTDALASMVALGAGYTVLAEEFARPLIDRQVICQIGKGKYLDLEVALAWYPRKHPPSHWQVVTAAIK